MTEKELDYQLKLKYSMDQLISGPTGSRRIEIFNIFISELRKRLEVLNGKIIWGYLFPDITELNGGKFDYGVVMKVYSTTGNPLILVLCPLVFTDHSLTGFNIAKDNPDTLKEHLDSILVSCTRISEKRFYEYITTMGKMITLKEFSLDPKEDNYWKNPNNAIPLINLLAELAIRYTPPKTT